MSEQKKSNPYFAQNVTRPIKQLGKRKHNEIVNDNPLTSCQFLDVNIVNHIREEFMDGFQDQVPQDFQRTTNQFQSQLKEYDLRNIKFCSEYYSYLSNLMLSRFSQQESAQDISIAYPLFKILREITKKFMLNELEIIFFLHIIEETKWLFNDPLIIDFASQFNYDFLNIVHEVNKADDYKRLILYLVSCAYAIKGYLNEDQDMKIINVHLHQFIKLESFQRFMEQWRQRFMQGSFRILPRTINKFFNRTVKTSSDQPKSQMEDYNALVDQIISISPPYSSEKLQQTPQIDINQLLKIKREDSQILINQQHLYPSLNLNLFSQNSIMSGFSQINSTFQQSDQFFLGPDNQFHKAVKIDENQYQIQQTSPKKIIQVEKFKEYQNNIHQHEELQLKKGASSISVYLQSDSHQNPHQN